MKKIFLFVGLIIIMLGIGIWTFKENTNNNKNNQNYQAQRSSTDPNSINKTNYRVMKRIDSSHIQVFIK